MPAMIDKILSISSYPKLFYGGISLAGTFYVILCSERPGYEDVFFASFHLAPSFYMPGINEYPRDRKIIMETFYKLFVSYINILEMILSSGFSLKKKNIIFYSSWPNHDTIGWNYEHFINRIHFLFSHWKESVLKSPTSFLFIYIE